MSAPRPGMRPRTRMLLSIAKWMAISVFGLFVVILAYGLGGYPSPFPDTEVTHERPYAEFVGREYRVTGNVGALAWNDFPDKAKILSFSLTPLVVRNRFVSYRISLQPGQKVRIVSAWRRFVLVEFRYHYVVYVPGAGLPDGIPITMKVNSDGIPDPLLYEVIQKTGG